ncbi:MAG TPA: hypothetical protein VEI97_11740, partial [bacterium]|nr:hypothetical protein [bacterium]
ALDELVAAQIGWAGLPRAAAAHLAVYGEVFLAVRDPGGDFIADHARRPPRLELIPPMEVRRVVLRPDGSLAGILREYATPSPVDVAHLERDPRSGLFPQALRMAVEFIAGERIVHVTAQAGAPGVRGVPPLARVIPWVEQYDQWLMDRVRINRARGAFAFLRKVPGWGIDPANPAASATDQQKVPKPGSVLVVSDQESWEVLEPRVGADDASSDGRALKLMVLAGAGIAEHYLGDLAQSNLATARAAELPMLKRFEAHQLQVLALFQDALQRALGMMGFSAQVSCTLPHPGVTDALALTRTLKEQLALGLISPQTARSLIPWITDVAEEERRIAQHQEEADH